MHDLSVVLLMACLHLHSLSLNCLIDRRIAAQLLPHLLEGWIALYLLRIIRPLNLVFILCFIQNVPPILLFEVCLDLLDVFVGLIQHIDGLDR